MSNVFPPSKDIHETYDLKVDSDKENVKSVCLFICLFEFVGLHARKTFAGRRNPQKPICSDEGSQLGKETT